MQDAVYASLSSSLGMHWGGGNADVPYRTGNRHGGLAESPYNVYPATDGWVAIICVRDEHWQALVRVMGQLQLLDDPRFRGLKARVKHMEEVDAAVGEWTVTLPREEIFQRLIDAKVPCAPVRELDEVVVDENMHMRGALQMQDHPELGRITVQQTPLRFAGLEPMRIPPSRPLGADTAEMLTRHTTFDQGRIAALVPEAFSDAAPI